MSKLIWKRFDWIEVHTKLLEYPGCNQRITKTLMSMSKSGGWIQRTLVKVNQQVNFRMCFWYIYTLTNGNSSHTDLPWSFLLASMYRHWYTYYDCSGTLWKGDHPTNPSIFLLKFCLCKRTQGCQLTPWSNLLEPALKRSSLKLLISPIW